jgi:anaerobic magnesium-protoporphyrin IX monomethyl ester cyclase
MTRTIDILFVNPNGKKDAYGSLASTLSGIEPPLWCGLKAAYIREKGHSVYIIDAEAEDLSPQQTAARIIQSNPLLLEIVVMGINPSASSTPKMPAVREMISALSSQQPKMHILLSGLHPSALPERTLNEEDASFICVGEGLNTYLKLLETLKTKKDDFAINGLWYKENGRIISNERADVIANLDTLPFIAWDLLPMQLYRAHNWQCFHDLKSRQPYAVIYTSLGCPYNCTYCNIQTMYECRPSIRFRSPEKVVDEIELLNKTYGIKTFKILDELFVLNEERVIKICDLIIARKLKLNIWAYARIDTVKKSILNKLKQAGINWLCFGIEAGSKKVRDGVHKGRFGQDAITESIKMTHDAGINVIGNFMFGLPEDDIETMKETFNMAKDLRCEYVNFYTVMAYPGSKLYEESIAKGVRLPDTWLGYAQLGKETVPLPNAHLTSEEILAFRDNAFIEYYSDSRYQKMIRDKFGLKAVDHINQMLAYKIERNILQNTMKVQNTL